VRSRILGVAVAAVALTVVLFGVPLAIAVRALLYTDETRELERLALRGALSVSPAEPDGDRVELPAVEPGIALGVYDVTGSRIAGEGPARGGPTVADASGGRIAERTTDTRLVVAVPVTSGERVVAVTRASSPRGIVARRVAETWGGMLGLALLAGGCASLLAAVQARRVNRPLERLVTVARSLGEGDFHIRARPSGVEEMDRVGEALNATAARIDGLLGRERAFSAHASHQLRTPLTSLRLQLETALVTPGADLEAAARQAVAYADQLSSTVDDVLALARGTGGATAAVDIADLLAGVRLRWHGPLAAAGRPLRIDDRDAPATAAAHQAAVRQILDVLLDNAARHGRGAVTVLVRETEAGAAVDVSDEGSTRGRQLLPVEDLPRDPAAGGRLGLALAARLAEEAGGRLLHARTEEATRFTLLIPGAAAEEVPDGSAGG
jgi:signal transduction histidine kinase